jgi:hypothetical protein
MQKIGRGSTKFFINFILPKKKDKIVALKNILKFSAKAVDFSQNLRKL